MGNPQATKQPAVKDATQARQARQAVALPASDEPTIGRLVNDATKDISTLIKKEIELAKSELKISIKFGVTGVVFFVLAAFIALLAIIMLSVAFAYLIHWNGDGLDLHWAFLIVFGAYLAIAALLGFLGVKQVKKAGPPEKAIEQGKQIPAALKGKTS